MKTKTPLLVRTAVIGALIFGSALGGAAPATAATISAAAPVGVVDTMRAPGPIPMYCKTILVKALPWWQCISLNPTGKPNRLCYDHYEVRCGY